MYKKKKTKPRIIEELVMNPNYMDTLRLLDEGVTLKVMTDQGRLAFIRTCLSRCRREGHAFTVKYCNPENYMLITKVANSAIQHIKTLQ